MARRKSCFQRLSSSSFDATDPPPAPAPAPDSTPPPNPPNPPNPPTLPTTYPEPGIAVVSLANPDPTVESSTSPHGTKVCEHRLSPPTVLALYETLLYVSYRIHCRPGC
jgi:hypothetical protein